MKEIALVGCRGPVHSYLCNEILIATDGSGFGGGGSQDESLDEDLFAEQGDNECDKRRDVIAHKVKSFVESIVMALQAFLRGRGETAAVFRIQLFSSVAFWIPLFLVVRAYRPGIPAYWLTMIACAGLSAALLTRRALSRRPPAATC